ncbi:MAG: hypothetical protein F4201_04925 [Nitrospira sp. SB0677_bin_15]|nr:hypothetical protein [Nitrospira sp. SB0667_bin_9]MYD31849.1 hypothetical protein [Nitrospira sp. SB0661_bin_20]MYG40147.1 hypothetical protein [Nitrospira sp. SB0677_bin_15]MYH01059.1 hypothetical protein [Nitrospira sp. SB0675_bin_23]MYJ22631.1 hypothetical protein [Nitrospira sp. SB0673_bin_12]
MAREQSLPQPEIRTAGTRGTWPYVLLLVLAGSLCGFWPGQALAEHPSQLPLPFDLIKTLVGTWQGNKQTLNGQETITVEYALTARGTAVVERIFPDTPKEMVSIYTQDGHEMVMTHYCLLGNQPRMKTSSPVTGNFIPLSYIDGTGMRSVQDKHMHKLTLTIIDNRHINHEWTVFENGRELATHTFAFARR